METNNYVLSENSAKIITIMRQLQTMYDVDSDLIEKISGETVAEQFRGAIGKARIIVGDCLINNIDKNEDKTENGKSMI